MQVFKKSGLPSRRSADGKVGQDRGLQSTTHCLSSLILLKNQIQNNYGLNFSGKNGLCHTITITIKDIHIQIHINIQIQNRINHPLIIEPAITKDPKEIEK